MPSALSLPKMVLQSLQRRPSCTLIAFSLTLFILFLLFKISPSSAPSRASHLLHPARPASPDIVDDVFNKTLGFEKVFVINLPSRPDRRDAFLLPAALSNIDVEFIDGVRGETVPKKSLPLGAAGLRDGEIGCWRAHADALRTMIQRNLSSVLILEDDADWDVRLGSQLHDFALSALALTKPLSHTQDTYADATYPTPKVWSQVPAADLPFDGLPLTDLPRKSPYGDSWDMLWLGHCGMRFPSGVLPESEQVPKGRVIYSLDPTVPEKQYLHTLSKDDLVAEYPSHTRAFHHVAEGICSLGYAITQAGARRLLHSITAMEVSAPYDIMLRRFCEGTHGRKRHNCLTMQPALFKHHRPAGPTQAESDISDHGTEYRKKAKTDNIRWSARLNMEAMLEGGIVDFSDQYPDTS